MSGIALTIKSEQLDELISSIETLGAAMKGDQLLQVMGRSVAQTLQDHFAQLAQDEAHHRSADSLGATRRGFYTEARSAVQQPQIEGDGVSVSIDQQGLAQRLFGGTIEAEPGRLLTIPARSETYGHRAREFSNLRLILFPSGAGALVERDATVLRGGARGGSGVKKTLGLGGHRKGDELGGLIYFWLVKQVTQPADPTVLPTEDEILDPVIENGRAYLEKLWGR